MMKKDPYTLYVALDPSLQASGKLYMDDEESFGYSKRQEYALAVFTADLSAGKLSNKVTVGSGWTSQVSSMAGDRLVERIVIMGMKKAPKRVALAGSDEELSFVFNADQKVTTIRKPEVSALLEWEIQISF